MARREECAAALSAKTNRKGFRVAAFREHVAFSTCLGAGYAGVLYGMGVEWPQSVLAAAFCGVSGMLPDLDSDSGKPIRELFGLAAAIGSVLLIGRMRSVGYSAEESLLAAILLYVVVRFGVQWLFAQLSVHRGMFHSLPAAAIAAEAAYLAHESTDPQVRLIMAAAVLLGFLSHLILDEIYSVDMSGLKVRLKSSAGSALKLFSSSATATVATWLAVGILTYLVCAERGYLPPVDRLVQNADGLVPR